MGLLLHAMFGANGMVVYRQKRAEMKALQSQVDRLQKENSEYADQIRSLKSDPAAIEKEAREQLHYTRQGEVVYVAPDPPQKPATGNAKNGKWRSALLLSENHVGAVELTSWIGRRARFRCVSFAK